MQTSTATMENSVEIPSVQFSSVAQSCPTLCDPMNHSTPRLLVHQQLPEFTQTHIPWVNDASQPSHPLLSPSPSAHSPSQHQGLFQWVNFSHEVAKVLEFLKKLGQRLIEFCQENALVIADILFQQHKRRLYTWTSPDSPHQNQIDYILCSQRWRSSIQSAKTRLGADCGSDHELLIAKFRHKLKKVGKTTRLFNCDQNQVP